jgi:dienelactone hydrolase
VSRGVVLAAAGLIGVLLAVPAALGLAVWQGWLVERLPATRLAELLRPAIQVHKPEGDGPFPAAVLVSGCMIEAEKMARWAALFTAHGWVAVVPDSYTPRGWNRPEVHGRICRGQMFWGTARAGDVLVALDEARRLPFVDPDRILLAGWSHGGWAVMDLLAFDPPRRLPFNLNDLPPGFAAHGLKGVVGVLLVYPYCGLGNRARGSGWRHPAEVLMLLGGADRIVALGTCRAIAEALQRRGQKVAVHVYPGIDHGFDDPALQPDSPLIYDPITTADAFVRVGRFLDRLRED